MSWILMPGTRTEPTLMGRASLWRSGKSTWTLRHCVRRGDRQADAEGAALLHALEDEVDAIGILLFHAFMWRSAGKTWSSLQTPFSAHSIASLWLRA